MTNIRTLSLKLIAAFTAAVLTLSVLFGVDIGSFNAGAAANGFYVDGTTVYDANGKEFIMRGVNIAHAWYTDKTEESIIGAARLGANTVRVVLANGQQWTKTTEQEVENIINICKENKVICILEVHDATGRDSADDLYKAVDYWVEMKSLLNGNEKYVILNIANEWFGTWDGYSWGEGNKEAVKRIRNAGISNMIMVDCAGWGQYPDSIKDYGRAVFEADPDKNTVFSIHMYEYAGGNADMVRNNIDNALGIGVPVVIGEFGGQHTDGDVDEATIMSYCTEKNSGYLGWSWMGNNSNLAYLDIVTEWDGSSLTEWGNALINGEYGIKNTSKICTVFSGGTQDPDDPDDPDDPVDPVDPEHTHEFAAPKYYWADDNTSCIAKADCAKCDYFVSEEVTAAVDTTAATCTTEGKAVYTAVFNNSVFKTQTKTAKISQTAHKYGNAAYTWSSDNDTCTASRECTVCGNKQTEKVSPVKTVTAATCTAEGKTVYTATFKASYFEKQVKTVKTAKTAHDFSAPAYYWSGDNKTCMAKADCKKCNYSETEEVTATVKTVAATCTAAGKTIYTAVFKSSVFTAQTKTVESAAAAHKYGSAAYTWSNDNICTAVCKCTVCGDKHTETVIARLTGSTAATCTKAGKKVYTATFEGAMFKTQTNTVSVKAAGHKYGTAQYKWSTDNKTCTASKTCSVCKAKLTQTVNTTAKTTAATYFAAGKTVYTAKFTKSGLTATKTKTVTIAKKVLSKVTGLKVSARTDTTITLKWGKVTGASGYAVQQYKGGKWTTVKKVTSGATVTYKVTGLKAGTSNKFKVKAYVTSGGKIAYGADSTTLSAYTKPSETTNLRAAAKTKTAITLKWDKNTTGTGYEIQMIKNGKWVTIKTIAKNTTVTYKVSGLKAGTQYKFRVRAYRDKQYGAYSATLTASTTK